MTHKRLIVLWVLGLFLIYGCGLRETVSQKEKTGYLNFTGSLSNVTVYIDDLEPMVLTGGKNVHYEISAGRHHITVVKDGSTVVDRNILLGSGAIKEIKIP